MLPENYVIHAQARVRHRNAPADAVAVVMTWGRWIFQRAGRVACFLGRREVREAARYGLDLSRYDGLAVVQAPDNPVITFIRAGSPHRLVRAAG
jgi:hypothetical protein